MALELAALTEGRLDEFEQLLGGPEFGGCFCAVWTQFGDDWGERCADAQRPNLRATREDVIAGRAPGFLVEMDGEIIAWTGSGPKSEFPLLARRLGARLSKQRDGTWCIGCLAISQKHRSQKHEGHSLSSVIVELVLREAQRQGAERVEVYPTDPWDDPRSYRGAFSMYSKLGFREVARERDGAAHIVLMVKDLPPA